MIQLWPYSKVFKRASGATKNSTKQTFLLNYKTLGHALLVATVIAAGMLWKYGVNQNQGQQQPVIPKAAPKAKVPEYDETLPRFEFYENLTKQDLVDKVILPPNKNNKSQFNDLKNNNSNIHRYYIQTGFYSSATAAAQDKAFYTLNGFQTEVIAEHTNNKQHKIRLGPFTSLQAANAAKDQLLQLGMQNLVIIKTI